MSHCSTSHFEKREVHKMLAKLRQVAFVASHIRGITHCSESNFKKFEVHQKISKNASSHIWGESHFGIVTLAVIHNAASFIRKNWNSTKNRQKRGKTYLRLVPKTT